VLDLLDAETATAFAGLGPLDRLAMIKHMEWVNKAHPYQIPPDLQQDWTVWLLLAGRGAGKSHAGSHALWWWCWTHPNSRGLVLAPTSNDVKFTCFEGVSGLIANIPRELVANYNKQDHVIDLVNGSSIRGISADSYERLRGPSSTSHGVMSLRPFNTCKTRGT